MKKLLVLWDPDNPQVPAAPVVRSLRKRGDVSVKELTFEEIGHPTLPNRAFPLEQFLWEIEPDGLLWIEGGPLPADLSRFRGPKACWLVNTHLESTLKGDLGAGFDRVFTTHLEDTADETVRWLPLAAGDEATCPVPEGLSLLIDDPIPPLHADVAHVLRETAGRLTPGPTPVVICMGNGGRAHPLLFDCLRSGAAVVVDPDSDLRGIAHVGEHLEVFPSLERLPSFMTELLGDRDRMIRLSRRGPEIVEHLHQPDLRAAEIVRGLWSGDRVLSARTEPARVSVLVTCYRYLKRLKVCLESLARQKLPPGSLEVVVADPQSPDGLAGCLEDFSEAHPQLRVVHVRLDPRYHRNRGVGINRAFDASTGEVVIGIDGDIVFPDHMIGLLEGCVLRSPDRVFGVRRSFTGKADTEKILSGELDPFADFARLARSDGDGEVNQLVGVLGYCQAVLRSAFARARYPEEFDMVNQSDIVFVERLAKQANVRPEFLEVETVLHLWHPRNWMGTSESL